MRVLIFILFVVSSLNMSIQTEQAQKNKLANIDVNNFKFNNYTGAGITEDDMVKIFNFVINDVYSTYRQDVLQNAKNIVQRLQSIFIGRFQTLIISQNNTGRWTIYTLGGNSYVVWSKVNQYKPNWVYIINILSIYTDNTNSYLKGFHQLGKGVNTNKQKVIQNIIIGAQGSTQCTCITSTINSKLQDLYKQQWSVLCTVTQNNGGFVGSILSKDQQYVQTYEIPTKSNRCRYLIWAKN